MNDEQYNKIIRELTGKVSRYMVKEIAELDSLFENNKKDILRLLNLNANICCNLSRHSLVQVALNSSEMPEDIIKGFCEILGKNFYDSLTRRSM